MRGPPERQPVYLAGVPVLSGGAGAGGPVLRPARTPLQNAPFRKSDAAGCVGGCEPRGSALPPSKAGLLLPAEALGGGPVRTSKERPAG